MTTSEPTDVDSSLYLIKRLIREYMRPYLGKLGWAMFFMIVVAATTGLLAWIVKPTMDEIFVKANPSALIIITSAVIIVTIIKSLAMYAQDVMMGYIGQRIVTNMQLALYSHLLHADLSLINQHSSGKLISRFNNDITNMRLSVSTLMTGLAKDFLSVVFLVGVMFYQSLALALIAFLVFPLAIYPIIRLGKRMRKVSHKTQHELGNFTTQLDETFNGIRVIKSYGQEAFETQRAHSIVDRLFGFYMKATSTGAAVSPIMETLTGITIAGVIWYGGSQVISHNMTQGEFFSFTAAMIMAYRPLKSLSVLNTKLQEGLASARRLFSLMDTQPQITEKPDAKPLLLTNGSIRFDSVSFHYDEGKTALSDLSFTVPGGRTVALVGPSGGGKSTIMNLILRFYDPDKGMISIDGMNIRNITLSSLREAMAIVSQEVVLFEDTIRANIAYGKPDATDEEIMAAAYNAAAHDFITAFPEGYDTIVGQHGMKLSGGQRQRISIARAMLRNPPILLLDEATSALDPISEQQVQQALQRLMQGRTTLVIAHRLSTIMNADMIYVVHNGSVAESGTHEQLLGKGGIYRTLYNHQFQEISLEGE